LGSFEFDSAAQETAAVSSGNNWFSLTIVESKGVRRFFLSFLEQIPLIALSPPHFPPSFPSGFTFH
ncbi:hypothetical protein K0M31_000283, partial [Melipona bicolor]